MMFGSCECAGYRDAQLGVYILHEGGGFGVQLRSDEERRKKGSKREGEKDRVR